MNLENKIEHLEFIKEEIVKGKNKKDVLAITKQKWKDIKESTFNQLFAAAKLIARNEQRQLQHCLDDEKTKALLGQVMSELDRKVYLSKIAKGEILVEKGFSVAGTIQKVLLPPSASERIAAIVELNKMENLYEREKQKVIKDNKLEVKIIIPDVQVTMPNKFSNSLDLDPEYEVIDQTVNKSENGNQTNNQSNVC